METFLQQVINGLSLGAIYALIALGYTMVYGVLRLINFAHGDIYMLGAYAGFFAAGWFGVTQILSQHQTPNFMLVALIFIISMLLCAAAGVLMERLVYRPLRTSARLAAPITAIGVSMLLEYGGQAVFNPDPRTFPSLIPPHSLIDRPDFTLSLVQVVIVAVALLLMVVLQFIVLKTRIGRAM